LKHWRELRHAPFGGQSDPDRLRVLRALVRIGPAEAEVEQAERQVRKPRHRVTFGAQGDLLRFLVTDCRDLRRCRGM
jgi:hypothetical protein